MQYKTIKSRGESKYNPQLDEREIAICASPSASLNGEMLTRVNKRRLRCVYLHCAKLSRKKKRRRRGELLQMFLFILFRKHAKEKLEMESERNLFFSISPISLERPG